MLDADLAEIYGYSTKSFNQQVKNNIEKFDDDFRFQLTRTEYREILGSKFLTLEQGKYSKTSPYAFTEQGIYMLMTVLKGEHNELKNRYLHVDYKKVKDSKNVPVNVPLKDRQKKVIAALSKDPHASAQKLAEIYGHVNFCIGYGGFGPFCVCTPSHIHDFKIIPSLQGSLFRRHVCILWGMNANEYIIVKQIVLLIAVAVTLGFIYG